VPGVLAVITAETLKTVNLAWMPTLAGDVQMVLRRRQGAVQNQEVASWSATDRYAADDGVAKVQVEYEPLPVIIDPSKRWRRMLRCYVKTSPARPRARTARASTTTTSSSGRSATRI